MTDFAAIDELPEGMLDSTPTSLLVGPKKSWWRVILQDWQKAENITAGHLAGCPAWAFHYTTKKIEFPADTARRTKATVVLVRREDLTVPLFIRARSFGNRLTRKGPKHTFLVGDEGFDRRHLVYGHQAAGALLTPSVRALLLSQPVGMNVDLGRGWLVVLIDGHGDPTQMLETADALVRSIPSAAAIPSEPPRRRRFSRRR